VHQTTTAIDVVPHRWIVLAAMVACFMLTSLVRSTWPPLIPVVVPTLHLHVALPAALIAASCLRITIAQNQAGPLPDPLPMRPVHQASRAN
jgi:hypothetical protein